MNASFARHAARLGHETSSLEVERPITLEWPLPSITLQNNVDILVERWIQMPETDRPTGLFVPSDRTAVQAYASFAKRNLRVGEDVSIISCNNEKPLLANMNPTLTTIDVHAELIGQRSVDQLLWRIANPNQKCHFQSLVEPTLEIGNSVKQL